MAGRWCTERHCDVIFHNFRSRFQIPRQANPLFGEWTQLADFANGEELRASVIGFYLNGRIFMGFGVPESGNSADANNLWEYIPD